MAKDQKRVNVEQEAHRLTTQDYVRQGKFGGYTTRGHTKRFNYKKTYKEHLKRLNEKV